MRIYLGRIKLLVSEDVLDGTDINLSGIIHQGRGCMAQLVNGISLPGQPGCVYVFVYEPLNRLDRNAPFIAADKKSVFISYIRY
ncbi:hypothetical protein SDC9_104631 [bioreactor metagenome]|uniref:Uncharacterized protein n=1 Tax=bioreactor metagenome TaxID=1076179 RepID=A0A645AYG5_9ZZZZ